LREGAEKLYLLLVGRLPLIVHLKCTLQVLFDFHIKSLRFNIDEGRIVNSWDGLGRDKMMKVACQLCKLGTGCLLLTLLFL
jgi:hypothetical protein